MVSVSEASRIILNNLYSPGTITCPLTESVGKVIAETITADRDFPPFDRVMMDGIGVSYEQLLSGQREFNIEGIQPAGVPQKKLNIKTNCLEVMTGAIVPEGIDTVIRYEDVEIANGKAHVSIDAFKLFQNIHARGIDVKENNKLIAPGQILSAAEVALLASVGKSEVKVKSTPGISIISTGDELVDVNAVPELHQIRRSNSYALHAALYEMGITASLHHVIDREIEIENSLKEILKTSDAIILSGGVSKGKFDFVPKVLEKLGVKKLFHQVSQRPGKPFWFGTSNDSKVVFALPGNPVSTFMCYYRFIQPWLMKSLGTSHSSPTAILAKDFTFQPPLTYFLQVKIKVEDGRLMAYPVIGGGSGDFANLGDVDGFLELPLECSEFKAGEVFPFVGFRH